ncbi:MAG TPA: ACT domain-containing protein [Gaiellaceae bacterium]|nr:ACT domain-containing protein [Gaiellaceae bacterium]
MVRPEDVEEELGQVVVRAARREGAEHRVDPVLFHQTAGQVGQSVANVLMDQPAPGLHRCSGSQLNDGFADGFWIDTHVGGRVGPMSFDLVIEIKNEPGALAQVAAAVSDAGVNLAAATCLGTADNVELHILVPHPEAAKHALALSHLVVSHEREVVVVEVEDRPGVLADLTRKVAQAGVDLDLVYVATRNRIVFGAADLDALKAVFEQQD